MDNEWRMGRRGLMQVSLAGALAGCSTKPDSSFEAGPPLAPIRASTDRIFDIAVCLRPFRAAGPRSTPSGGRRAGGAQLRPRRQRLVAVLGIEHQVRCGKAMQASPARSRGDRLRGARADLGDPGPARRRARDDLCPRAVAADASARATGDWTPDSRIALADAAGPDFAALWEEMARTSFKTHRDYLGLPGTPVEWIDQYSVSDRCAPARRTAGSQPTSRPWSSRLTAAGSAI